MIVDQHNGTFRRFRRHLAWVGLGLASLLCNGCPSLQIFPQPIRARAVTSASKTLSTAVTIGSTEAEGCCDTRSIYPPSSSKIVSPIDSSHVDTLISNIFSFGLEHPLFLKGLEMDEGLGFIDGLRLRLKYQFLGLDSPSSNAAAIFGEFGLDAVHNSSSFGMVWTSPIMSSDVSLGFRGGHTGGTMHQIVWNYGASGSETYSGRGTVVGIIPGPNTFADIFTDFNWHDFDLGLNYRYFWPLDQLSSADDNPFVRELTWHFTPLWTVMLTYHFNRAASGGIE